MIRLSCIAAALLFCSAVQAQPRSSGRSGLPSLPFGLDAYRQWQDWPLQRLGVRAYMRSTYQRAGTGSLHRENPVGYPWTDASHFLFFNEDEQDNVTLDVRGRGALYFFRSNHWHGSPWKFTVDGRSHIVRETATVDPVNAKKNLDTSVFLPAEPFPSPLNWTWATTKGADLIWTPMPFRDSFSIAYGRTFYGTGYYIYHHYNDEVRLSQPIQSWDFSHVPSRDVLSLLDSAGLDIAPKNIPRISGRVKLEGDKVMLAHIRKAPSTLRALKLSIPLDQAEALERARLIITWDGAAHPSIDAPLCLFFGTGTFFNREKKEFLVRGLPINVRFDFALNRVELACYYPMPFWQSARIELADYPAGATVEYEFRYMAEKRPKKHLGYFHATYRDFPKPELGKEVVFLDTRGVEGHEEWSGSFVGNSFIFSHTANLTTLEGDPKFYFDDARSPQAQGTGTEEWAGGGDYWGGENMTLPLAGHPVGARRDKVVNEKDKIQSGYRFLLADLMPFGKRAVTSFEHGENLSQEHYESVSYWYGLPAPSLIHTDSLDVGDPASEKAHAYLSPDASETQTIVSTWDGTGLHIWPEIMHGQRLADLHPEYKDLVGKRVYPDETQDGRHTRTYSEFTVRLDPNNLGVLLRRTLDYSFPNQTAEVLIADEAEAASGEVKWKSAGIWYLAGSTTYLFSRPRGPEGRDNLAELEKRRYDVRTSPKRFREDEFLLPPQLTRSKSQIRVRIRVIPDDRELYPGYRFPRPSAWSELKYDVFSIVEPDGMKKL